ncbi:MAG: DUF4423 domain-containing protein [Bdellovibrionaceae bacterium]|nr:DUF4423 domain-containing protein [Bdellovibrio sp.]
MTIYSHNSYIEALTPAIEERRQTVAGWTLARLAQACQMQPSYLTNVLKGRCDFNSDQLYKVCEELAFGENEIDYLQLLLELKKTVHEKRRVLLNKKIKQMQSEHLRAEKHLTTKTVKLTAEQLQHYYLNPYIQLVHIYLETYKGVGSAEVLAKKFSVSRELMAGVLKVLEEVNYIRKKGNNYEVLVEGQHLPRESILLRPHHVMMRMKSLDQMQRLAPEQNYSFSATISTLPEIRTQIQAEFLKFLKSAEKLVRGHDSTQLYQINFDLFPWEIN